MGNAKSEPIVGEAVTAIESGDQIASAGVLPIAGETEEANKIKTQKNQLKRSLKNAKNIPDPELAYKDTIQAAKKLHKVKKNGTLKGNGHVKKFKTNGKQSGITNKEGPYKIMKRQPKAKAQVAKKSNREITHKGMNSSGNNYTSYSDGGYRYSNKGSSGKTSSTYYDTGKGHAFYENKSQGYSYHENQNQGTRSYKSKK